VRLPKSPRKSSGISHPYRSLAMPPKPPARPASADLAIPSRSARPVAQLCCRFVAPGISITSPTLMSAPAHCPEKPLAALPLQTQRRDQPGALSTGSSPPERVVNAVASRSRSFLSLRSPAMFDLRHGIATAAASAAACAICAIATTFFQVLPRARPSPKPQSCHPADRREAPARPWAAAPARHRPIRANDEYGFLVASPVAPRHGRDTIPHFFRRVRDRVRVVHLPDKWSQTRLFGISSVLPRSSSRPADPAKPFCPCLMCTTSRPEIGARRSAPEPAAAAASTACWSAASRSPIVVTDIFTTVDSCSAAGSAPACFSCCISRTSIPRTPACHSSSATYLARPPQQRTEPFARAVFRTRRLPTSPRSVTAARCFSIRYAAARSIHRRREAPSLRLPARPVPPPDLPVAIRWLCACGVPLVAA